MSYPFDPKGIGRRTIGADARGHALNTRFDKSQQNQTVRPYCPSRCDGVTAVPGLVFNKSYSPPARPPTPATSRMIGDIVWADPDDHDKTFGVELRNGWENLINIVYMNITSFSVEDEVHVFETVYASGFSLFLVMYYKDGSEIIQVSANDGRLWTASSNINVFGHVFPATMLGTTQFSPHALTCGTTQAWETVGHQDPDLRPSGFALAAEFTRKSSINLTIDPLLIISRSRS